jgi:hypothetical protein
LPSSSIQLSQCQNRSLEHLLTCMRRFRLTGCHVAFRSAYGDAVHKELSGYNYRDVLGAFRKVLCIIIDRSAHCRLQREHIRTLVTFALDMYSRLMPKDSGSFKCWSVCSSIPCLWIRAVVSRFSLVTELHQLLEGVQQLLAHGA